MIGNDLVDLRTAARESNWKRKGFLQKLFSIEEQKEIHAAAIPEEMVWLIWSMKEAAYKIHNKRSGIREYAPLKFQCRITRNTCNVYYGEVTIADAVIYTRSQVYSNDYIHTIAADHLPMLQAIREKIYPLSLKINYRMLAPTCVSHHGQYLALIF